MPTALITGYKGFIGSYLYEQLRNEGWKVFGMDLPQDVGKKRDWQSILSCGPVNYIFHLAGQLDDYYEGKPNFASYIDVNIRSIALMFEVIAENKIPIKKILVASSQSVYGEGDNKNEFDKLEPLSLYGASKAAMEQVFITLGRNLKIPSIALRYSIVLGPGQKYKDRDSRILPCFVKMAEEGLITIHEDGNQTRDFINIHDLIDAHLFIAKNDDINYGPINVGSGTTTKVIEVAEYIANKFNAKIYPSGKKRINTARNQTMNINLLKTLGWKPRFTWKDAVDEYIKAGF